MIGQVYPSKWLTDILAAYEQVLSELFWFPVGFGVVYS
jgi:hypothetical protein